MATNKMTINSMSFVTRSLIFFLIWWVLTDGVIASLWIGIPAITLAVFISIQLLPTTRFNGFQFLFFIPFFLKHSLHGGIDVAWRAFHPAMPIAPDFIEYKTKLPPGLPQVFMAITLNLLPGTLSVTIKNGVIKVHVLDKHSAYLAEIEAVEKRVTRLFYEPLKPQRVS